MDCSAKLITKAGETEKDHFGVEAHRGIATKGLVCCNQGGPPAPSRDWEQLLYQVKLD